MVDIERTITHSVFGVIFGGMGLINVGTSLSPVEGGGFRIIDALDLQEDLVFVLCFLAPIEGKRVRWCRQNTILTF